MLNQCYISYGITSCLIIRLLFLLSVDDGELFMDDCNLCTCFSGELTCTRRHCSESVLSPEYNASKLTILYKPCESCKENHYPSQCFCFLHKSFGTRRFT